MKGEMAWTSTRFELGPRLIVGFQFSLARVELVNHDSIQSKIGSEHISVGLVQYYAVGVRYLLGFCSCAATLVLDDSNGSAQCPIVHGHDRDVPAGVICQEHKSA